MDRPQQPDPKAVPAGGATQRVRGHARAASGRPATRWHSRELLGQASEVEIVHGSQVYRLRCTALGKLILTK